MKRPVQHARASLTAARRKVEPLPDQTAEQPDQPAETPPPNALRLDLGIYRVKGPDGRWWVQQQTGQGALIQALSIAPENVEDYLRVIGRDMRAIAAECRAHNGGSAHRSGLIVAGPGDVPRFPSR